MFDFRNNTLMYTINLVNFNPALRDILTFFQISSSSLEVQVSKLSVASRTFSNCNHTNL